MLESTGRTIVTAPSSALITLSAAKLQLREDLSDQDELIESIIAAAYEKVEADSWRALLPQTWEFYYDYFPACGFDLPLAPLRSVDFIKYVDPNGVTQTLSSSLYQVDASSEPGRIRLAFGATWPLVRDYTVKAVTVRANVGYASAAAVPRKAVQAAQLLIGHWYANRESVIVGTISSEIQHAYDSLLDSFSMRERVA